MSGSKRFWRIAGPIGLLVLAFVALRGRNVSVGLYKVGIASCAVLGAHVGVKLLFPYLDLEHAWAAARQVGDLPAAVRFAAAAFVRAIVMAAIIIGVCVGL